jgi:hypothetical protein
MKHRPTLYRSPPSIHNPHLYCYFLQKEAGHNQRRQPQQLLPTIWPSESQRRRRRRLRRHSTSIELALTAQLSAGLFCVCALESGRAL